MIVSALLGPLLQVRVVGVAAEVREKGWGGERDEGKRGEMRGEDGEGLSSP